MKHGDDYDAEIFDYWSKVNRKVVKNTLEILDNDPGKDYPNPVTRLDPDTWLVVKPDRRWDQLRVYRRGGLLKCSQDRGKNQDDPCTHILLVMLFEGMIERPDTSGSTWRKNTKHHKDQPNQRNKALEDRAWKAVPLMVPDLLARLLHAGVPIMEAPEPPNPGPGRPRARLYPQVYQAVMRVWHRQSLVAAQGAMSCLDHQQHNPYGAVGASTLSRFLRSPEATEVLEKLLLLSTWPARPYESIFHQDGTGFTRRRFGFYFKKKYANSTLAKKMQHQNFLFSVILWSYRYSLIPALYAADGNFGEPEWTNPLLERTRLFHRVAEFGGDRAYVAGYIFDYAKRNGIDAQIKFKRNSTGSSAFEGKGAFNEALRLWKLDPKGYEARADRKQNVESGNHAFKALFGDKVYSEKPVGRRNELLCMAIAYNLTRLVYLSLEQDVEIEFDGGAQVLDAVEWESLDNLHDRFKGRGVPRPRPPRPDGHHKASKATPRRPHRS